MAVSRTAVFGSPLLLLLLAGFAASPQKAGAQEMALLGDRISLNTPIPAPANFTRVNFRRSYPAPPLVFVLPDGSNPDPAALRVTNITTTGFDIAQFEAPGEDARTSASQVSYLAISPGSYNMGGDRVEAGSVAVSDFQSRLIANDGWQTLAFSNSYANPATLLLEIQGSANGTLTPGSAPSPWLTAVARNVTGTSAEIALERSETTSGSLSNAEQVAYLALSGGVTGSFGSPGGAVQFEAIRSTNSISGWDNGCFTVPFSSTYTTPLVLAGKSSRDGADGGWLRRCALTGSSVGLTVDEDRSNDSDRSHTTEVASVLAVSRPFDANLTGGRGWEADVVNLPAYSGASLSFTQVSFPQPFTAVPLVFTTPVETGTNPASIRIRSVSNTGFEAAAVEPSGSPGAHESMTVDYYAVLPGSYRFDDGTEFEAGFIDTSRVQRNAVVGGQQGWDNVNFSNTYPATPALLAQIQTTANSGATADPALPFIPWLTVAVENLSASGVRLALERSEAAAGSVTVAERVGYFVMAADRHGTMMDMDGNPLGYDSRLFTSGVRGYDDGCFSVPFTAAFPAPPLAAVHGVTRNGNNGGWVRRCSLSSSVVGAHVDEDVSADAERSHINESVAVIAFESPFRWEPNPDLILTTTLLTISDGIGNPMPKAIPGAVLEYQVMVTNTGRGASDADSIVISDAVPAGTELFVGDLDGAGNPVVFVDGSPPNSSGLSFDPVQDLAFSNDNGGSFGYVPVAGDWDAAVTDLRVTPTGSFRSATGVRTPQFTLRYRVRVL